MALQASDLHGARFRRLADTGSLAEVFVGQTRAHIAPMMLAVEYGLGGGERLRAICRMKSGMSIEVGQAVMHGAS